MGALQEQPAGHRVQPVRGAAAAGAARLARRIADLDEETARGILAEVEPAGRRPARRVVRRRPTGTRRCSTRARTRCGCPSRFARRSAP